MVVVGLLHSYDAQVLSFLGTLLDVPVDFEERNL